MFRSTDWSLKSFLRCCLLLVVLLGSSFPLPARAHHKQQPLRIAITPCTEIIRTFKLFQPLANYLEQQLQRPVMLVIPKDFAEFEHFVRNGEADFAFQAPHTYVRLASLYNRELLLKALTPEGATRHRGVIIVRKDSPIKELKDLRGKRFLFGAENDLAKSLAVRLLLEKNGIIPERDFASLKNDGSCESISLNVFLKAVDAGAVCDYSFEDINTGREEESEIPAGQLRVLAATDEVPTWVFSAHKAIDPQLVRRVNRALTALRKENKEHHKILQSAEVGGFIEAKDNDFDEIRKIVASPTSPP